MKLYLAQIELRKTAYMGKETREKVLRLVRAADQAEARRKVEVEYEHCETGDDCCFVWGIELTETIE